MEQPSLFLFGCNHQTCIAKLASNQVTCFTKLEIIHELANEHYWRKIHLNFLSQQFHDKLKRGLHFKTHWTGFKLEA